MASLTVFNNILSYFFGPPRTQWWIERGAEPAPPARPPWATD